MMRQDLLRVHWPRYGARACPTLEQALHQRGGDAVNDVIHHSDRGVQYVSMRYTEHLADAGIALDRNIMRTMSPGLALHAVRAAMLDLAGDLQALSERHIAAVRDLAVNSSGGGRLDLPGSFVAQAEHDHVIIRAAPVAAPRLPTGGVSLSVPGQAALGRLTVAAGATVIEGADAQAEVDAEALGPAVCVRRWRPGDRIQPSGMQGTKKLQDLFVDAHWSKEQKAAAPVFESTRGILWVGGLRVAEWVDWFARMRDAGLREAWLPDVLVTRGLHRANHSLVQPGARIEYCRVLRDHLQRRRPGEGQ